MNELCTPGEGLSLADLQRVVEICTRFEDEWLAGRQPRVEDFLGQAAESARSALLRDLLRLDLHYRRKAGERPSPEEYRRRLPKYAAVIDATFAAAPETPAPCNGTAPDGPPMPPTEGPSSVSAGADGPALTAAPGYEVLGVLGRGAMGVVYKARQQGLKRLVALKMVLAGAHAGPAELARFRREAEAVARLRHPNIVQIYEVGEHAGLPFFSLEYVERGTLAELAAGKPLPPRRAAETVEALARAVHSAHQVGVVHRDLKPANVLIAADGTPKVTDFGLAKLLDAEDKPLTRTSAILGTPAYMAPEQVSREVSAVGPWSDVYALGVILYELLTGRAPFGGGVETVLLDKLEREPYPPRRLNAAAPRDLETVCLKCLRKEPSHRYRSAADLADDLRRYLSGVPIKARRAGVTERGWRWCRRNPVLATLTGLVAALLVLITAISVAASVQLRDHLEHARNAEQAEREAKEEALERLRGSYLAQARAGRFSRQPGQQFDSLEALAKAARIRPSLELRNEAVACMAVPDLKPGRSWEGLPGWQAGAVFPGMPERPAGSTRWTAGLVFDEKLERYARSDGAGNICVRRVADDKELVRLPGRGLPAWTLRFSPDGRFLCARIDHGTCRFWDVERRRLVVEPPAHAFDFTPDSRRAAVTWPDQSIKIYDLGSGREVKRLPKRPAWTHSLAFSPDGRQLAVSFLEPRVPVEVLDVETGKVVVTLPHPGGVRSLAWRPDGRLLATACDDLRIHLWDPNAARYVGALEGHEEEPIEVTFNHRGNLLASTGWDGTVRLWDPVAKRQVLSSPGGYPQAFPKYQFSPDDRRLAFSWDGRFTIGLWEVDAAPACQTLTSHRALGKGPWSMDVSPDGRLLASTHDDGVRLWDLEFGREVAHLDQFGRAKTALFTPDGQSLITYSGHGIHSWPVAATQEAQTLSLRIGPPRRLLSVSPMDIPAYHARLSADGNSLGVTDRARGQVILADLTGRVKAVLPGHPQIAWHVLSPDVRWVATLTGGSDPGPPVLRVSSVRTKKVVWQLADGSVLGGFSPDGRWLVTCRDQCCVREVGTWRVVKTIPAEPALGRPGGAVFSKDGKTLAIGYPSSRVVRLVDPETGKELVTPSAPARLALGSTTFSPDGSRLAIACSKRIIQVWDLRLIRARLAEMGLDWDAAPLPPARESPATSLPLAVTVFADNVAKFRKDVERNPRDARAHLRLGEALREKGQLDEAIGHLRKATELNPGDANAHNSLGTAWHARGRPDEAVRCYRKAIELDPKLAMARYNLGSALRSLGKPAEAGVEFRAALKGFQRLADDPSRTPEYRSDLAKRCHSLGHVLDELGKPADAEAAFRVAIKVQQRLADEHPTVPDYRRDLAGSHHCLGVLLHGRLGKPAEAAAQFRAALKDFQRLADEHPTAPGYRKSVAGTLGKLAAVLVALGDREALLALARRYEAGVAQRHEDLWNAACLVSKCVQLVRQDTRLPETRREHLARTYAEQAVDLLRQAVKAGWRDTARLRRDPDFSPLRGRDTFKKLLAELDSGARLKAMARVTENRKKLAASPDDPQLRADLAASHADLGSLHWQMGRHREALRDWQRARKTLEAGVAKPGAPGEQAARAGWRALGFAYVKAGLWAEAAACYERPLQFAGGPPRREPRAGEDWFHPALLRLRAGDAADYRRACAVMRQLFGKSDKRGVYLGGVEMGLAEYTWACALDRGAGVDPADLVEQAKTVAAANPTAWPRHILALACYRAGRYEEALAQATKSNLDVNWRPRNMNWPVLAMAHHRLGHAAEAREWLRQANEEWRKLSPLARAIDSLTVLPPSTPPWWQEEHLWQDWPIFELLLAEANALILGHRGEADCLDLLHRAYLHAKLGEGKNADEEFRAALCGRRKDPSAWLARGRVYRLLGDKDRARADFARGHELDPKDPQIQKEYTASGGKEKGGR
jgi:eukaryotic-like serine/threonine-protein kinase